MDFSIQSLVDLFCMFTYRWLACCLTDKICSLFWLPNRPAEKSFWNLWDFPSKECSHNGVRRLFL